MRNRVQGLDTSRGERFEIRTNTAVLGVIGTDFFVEALATLTRIIVYEGLVLVRNINDDISDQVTAGPGMIVLVYADQPPVLTQQVEASDLRQSLEETEIGEELPIPEEVARILEAAPPERRTFWQQVTKNKWLFVGVVAAIATVSISVPLATGGKTATGCELPPPSCPVSGP
jgi:ferric-dicitrate binding protein FerR (iron transport regulator)